MTEPKIRHKLPPCPAYDIPAMQGWLEDMAALGLHLEKDGFFGFAASFAEGPPKKERFRLEPTVRKGGLFSEEYDPADEQLQLLRQMGWTYRARRGQFHIYSSDDPNVPELNTDPQVQAMTLAALTAFLRKKLSNVLILTVFYLVLHFGDLLISSTLLLGTPLVLIFVGLLLWDLGSSLRAMWMLRRWRDQLRRGQPIPLRRDYLRSGRPYLAAVFVRRTLWILVVLCAFGRGLYISTGEQYEPLTDRRFPFYTVADYYPGARIERNDPISRFHAWEDLLSPENYDFREYTKVTVGSETFDCWLSVSYHRTRWAWTARVLAGEMISQAGANPFDQTAARFFGREPVIANEIQVEGADYCAWFYQHRSDPYIVLQRDNVVIRVNLDIMGSSTEPTAEELAQLILLQIQ